MNAAEGSYTPLGKPALTEAERARILEIKEQIKASDAVPWLPEEARSAYLEQWERFATSFFSIVRTGNTMLGSLVRPSASDTDLRRHKRREYQLFPYVAKGSYAHLPPPNDEFVPSLYINDDDTEIFLDAAWMIQLQARGSHKRWEALSTIAFRPNFGKGTLDIEQLQGWGSHGPEGSDALRVNRMEFEKRQQNPEELLVSIAEAVARDYGFATIRLRKPEHIMADKVQRKTREGQVTPYSRMGTRMEDPGPDSLYFVRSLSG